MRSAAVLLIASLFLTAGCATTTDSACRAPIGDRSVTPAVAAADPSHVGERVAWGGTLVEARNLADSTELEMIGYPLDACGRPRTSDGAVGRFIIVRAGYLEIAQLQAGQPITATGTILATREGQVGDAFYRFPLLADPNPRVWPDEPVAAGSVRTRPWISIGVGGGNGWSGGGVGISF
jgi:outer membrane lipoprotein